MVNTLPLLHELYADQCGMLSVGELKRRGHGELIKAAKEADQIVILSESRCSDLSSVMLLDAGFDAISVDISYIDANILI